MLSNFIVVCLFTQKTAYEMRISDWSSDVCSSDLAYFEISKYARVAHPEFPGINNRTQIKQNYHNSLQRIPAPMFPPRWNLDVPKFDDFGEIGRASCR